MRDEDEALDLSQDAWVKGWQRLAQFQGDSSFVTWMTRIVINLCLDQLRKQKRQRAESIEVLEDERRAASNATCRSSAPIPQRDWNGRNYGSGLIARWPNCRQEHRTALVLHEFEEMEYKEIAKRMKCSIGTVMSRLFYARRRMASLLAGLKRENLE